MDLQGITIFCFAASYAVALGLEMFNLIRPGSVQRFIAQGFTAAGVFAHGFYLAYHSLPLSGGPSSLLFLSWILAVFALYGSVHHREVAWSVFVLPLVLGMVLVAWFVPGLLESSAPSAPAQLDAWVWLHIALMLLGSVGLCVAFVASVMYLVQAYRLRHKTAGEGFRLLSLERLEDMNRRGIDWAFPLLTGGLLTGIALLVNTGLPWQDPKVLVTGSTWLLCGVLVLLRHACRLRGRRIAGWTIAAFGLIVLAFVVHFILPSEHHYEVIL